MNSPQVPAHSTGPGPAHSTAPGSSPVQPVAETPAPPRRRGRPRRILSGLSGPRWVSRSADTPRTTDTASTDTVRNPTPLGKPVESSVGALDAHSPSGAGEASGSSRLSRTRNPVRPAARVRSSTIWRTSRPEVEDCSDSETSPLMINLSSRHSPACPLPRATVRVTEVLPGLGGLRECRNQMSDAPCALLEGSRESAAPGAQDSIGLAVPINPSPSPSLLERRRHTVSRDVIRRSVRERCRDATRGEYIPVCAGGSTQAETLRRSKSKRILVTMLLRLLQETT